MTTAYRLYRNLEKSLKFFFTTQLSTDHWTGVTIEFMTKKGLGIPAPKFLIDAITTESDREEIGSGRFIKYPVIALRLFAKDDGQRKDLSEWAFEQLEKDIPYYIFGLGTGNIEYKTLAGNITVTRILRNEKEFVSTDPEGLEAEDRYRHIIQFVCYVGV
jgi:hypothetical protein